MTATDLELSALWAQWIGSIAAVGAVVVAVIFGYLTLANNRRSKDAQERAALIAATSPQGFRTSVLAEAPSVQWLVKANGDQQWLLINVGSRTAHDVEIKGLTELDERRLTMREPRLRTLTEGEAVEFGLVSRFTLAGPANLIVTYTEVPQGHSLQKVVLVPAP